MRRQQRLGPREPFDVELERRRTARQRPHETYAICTETVACDLVDHDRIEVVHGRVAVAVEGVGRDRRQRLRDLRELRLHRGVERRAPERVPAAVAVVEVGVHEPFGDGARDP